MGTKVHLRSQSLRAPARGKNVYLTEEMHEWLAAKASAAQLSVSSQIRTMLNEMMRAEIKERDHA